MSWIELLDGILMSDGNLTIPGQCHNPRYQQTCKEPTFLEWVRSWLPTEARITGPHAAGKYQYWLLSTRTSAIYAPAYHHWYPRGKKRLPADLQVSPELLLTEYLGDGFLHADAAKKLQHVEFGTYSFDSQSLIDFCQKLREKDLDFRLKPNNSLNLRGSRVKAFLRYLGPCPVLALAYKWQAIEIADLMWREILSVENAATCRNPGSAVTITLECGHSFRNPFSRMRSGKTNKTLCRFCKEESAADQ